MFLFLVTFLDLNANDVLDRTLKPNLEFKSEPFLFLTDSFTLSQFSELYILCLEIS